MNNNKKTRFTKETKVGVWLIGNTKAASVCGLPLLELYWFHALRQPLGSGVSPSTDLPSETVCHQRYVRQICRRTPSSGH